MAIRTKLAIALTVATASVFGLASSALAQNTIDVLEDSGLSTESGNAAAAILLNTDAEGNVLGVSAAAGFGDNGAAAVALPEFAGAVGANASNGDIVIGDYYGRAPWPPEEEGAEFSGVVGFFESESIEESDWPSDDSPGNLELEP
ncbi:MAG: hypothetical protein ACFB2X_26385 [Rivularia sp. (in: cyanobacteria)]